MTWPKAVGAELKATRATLGGLNNLSTEAKKTLVEAINEVLAKAKENAKSIGTNSDLKTTAKDSLVGALNELHGLLKAIDLAAVIDDSKTTAKDKTYSVDKILDLLSAQKKAITEQISGGITDTTMDSLKEIADFLKGDAAGGLVDALGKRVRADAEQNFSADQKKQARANIGAAAASDLDSLKTAADATKTALDTLTKNIGNTDADLVSAFNGALA